jgi:serine/threonine-protein kinase HSL1 (negative regulator of Swe1 kinase)
MAADPRDPQLSNLNRQPSYQQQVNSQNNNQLSTDSAELKRLSQHSASSTSKKTKAHVGPWRLGRTLGRGSSGRVRLAKHTTTGQLAAVKIVPKSVVPSPKYGIEREVIIMKLIEHPNVMALYDVWENKGELYVFLCFSKPVST